MFLIVNGDTLFNIDIKNSGDFHNMCGMRIVLVSFKPMQNFDRYGVVELNNDYSIKSFNEKSFMKQV